MPVLVSRQAPASPNFTTQQTKRLGEKMLEHLGIQAAELSVLLTDDETIRELNREHRGKDRPTDVLSFPLMDFEDEQLATLEGGALGDVVISLDTALKQAVGHRHDLKNEVARLLAHGLLHLLGYDHETDAEEEEMNRVTDALIASALRRQTR